jgi:hypothetical protein
MSTRQQATLPRVLSTARRQFDQWRSQHRKHTRLPQELWRQATALAHEHGLNKTSRVLGLKYYSLKKHLDEMTCKEPVTAKAEPDFIELAAHGQSRVHQGSSLIICETDTTYDLGFENLVFQAQILVLQGKFSA